MLSLSLSTICKNSLFFWHSKREKISLYRSAEVDREIEALLLYAGAQKYTPQSEALNPAWEAPTARRSATFSTLDTQFIALCRKGTTETVLKALAAGANANAKNDLNWTALMESAMHNPRAGVVKALLAAGAYVNAQDANGWSALMVAAMHNPNPEVVAALLSAGANVTDINSKGQNAYWCARNPGVLRTKAIPNMAKRRAVNEKIMRLIGGSAW